MHTESLQYFSIIIIGGLLALLLVGFIVAILFLYQRRQHGQEQQLVILKDQYDHELLRSQLEIQEATFRTIAQELHDNIGQVLSVIKLSLSLVSLEKTHPAFEVIQSSREMLNKVILDTSDITKSMHSDRIAHIGIVEAIRFELDILRKTKLLEIDFSLTGESDFLDDQKAIFIFRMFQEMINNILKHAQATRVIVSIIYTIDNIFVLKTADNGIGFDAEKKQEQVSSSSGIGLKSLKNRARLIGADISIESKPGYGTSVTIKLPLHTDNAFT